MIRQDPILIAAPPRSGTTMLAGLIYYHGVWIGRSRTTMYPGTNSNFGSENLDIKHIFKQIAKEIGYQNWDVPFPVVDLSKDVKDRIEHFVPENTPWLVKTSWVLVFWQFWHKAYPKARWLFPLRKTKKIVNSMNRHPGMRRHSTGKKREFIQALDHSRELAKRHVLFHEFGIERIAKRDRREIDTLFTFLDLEPNYTIIDDWINPEMLTM